MASLEEKRPRPLTDLPPLHVPCGACGKSLRVNAKLAGRKVGCPMCGRVTLVPGLCAAEASAEGAPVEAETAAESAAAPFRGRQDLSVAFLHKNGNYCSES